MMIKRYYKFDMSKESLITTEQSSYDGSNGPDIIVGIYQDTSSVPDIGNSTVKRQDGSFIKRGSIHTDIQGVQTKKELVGFLIENLFSNNLEGHYYESFMM